jgi:hypothetical protein
MTYSFHNDHWYWRFAGPGEVWHIFNEFTIEDWAGPRTVRATEEHVLAHITEYTTDDI